MADKCPSSYSPVQELKGDLFTCPRTSSLAHCVSVDLHMSKGIAVEFKKRFGEVEALKAQLKQIGECAVLKIDSRYVYYLITKEKYNHKPKISALRESVHAMRDHCIANGVTELSMPRIGCGLDRLDWSEVRQLLSEAFAGTQVIVSVYRL